MIEPTPIDQQIAKALDKFRKEHYPHRPKAIYLGLRQWTQFMNDLHDQHADLRFDGVPVYEIYSVDHLNVG